MFNTKCLVYFKSQAIEPKYDNEKEIADLCEQKVWSTKAKEITRKFIDFIARRIIFDEIKSIHFGAPYIFGHLKIRKSDGT